MYAITGISGQVGGAVAEALLDAHQPVRAVVRRPDGADAWLRCGCQGAFADMRDAAALTKAFHGAEAVFVLLPPNFDPQPGFPEARAIIEAVRTALTAARPARVVCLSTIGAQAKQTSLLSQLSIMEQVLGELSVPIAFLRAAWFMENFSWDVAPARSTGEIPSFLQPLDKSKPMVATEDVGRTAAKMLQESWTGRRVVELEGPRRFSPNDVAETFSLILGRPVHAHAVPRETWESVFSSQGMKNPLPRMQMLDGFNQGWIDFEGGNAGTVKGKVELQTVLGGLVQRAPS